MFKRALLPIGIALALVCAPAALAWADDAAAPANVASVEPAGSGSSAAQPATAPAAPVAAPAPVPAPTATAAPAEPDIGTVTKLWKAGAITPAIIVALFVVLLWLSTHVAWLQRGRAAVIVASAIGGLAMLVERASAGTTPTASMFVTAMTTSVALFMNPRKPGENQPAT